MYRSCLLLLCLSAVFSDINAASVEKRGFIPSNINFDLKLGKGSAAKAAESPAPTDGSRKTVINAPFGLASLTITTNNNRKNSTESKPVDVVSEKPYCDPESETIAGNNANNMKKPSSTLGGKGDAFFGPPSFPPPHEHHGFGPHPHPHPNFGPPPHDFHHSHHHYPPPPSHHHDFYPHPPPNHHHHPDCHHEEPFPSASVTTSHTKDPKIPEIKPEAKFTTVPTPTIEKVSQTTSNMISTTDNLDSLIGDVFGGSSSSISTTMKTNIDINNPEQTGEGNMDIRMPKHR